MNWREAVIFAARLWGGMIALLAFAVAVNLLLPGWAIIGLILLAMFVVTVLIAKDEA